MRICATCGTKLAEAGPEGLCPKCFLEEGLAERQVAVPESAGPVPFGDYELLGVIARGGMGVVYRARQVSLDRIVAVKMMLAGPWAGADFARRFQAEARSAASLRHPNIVAIHEIGEHDGQPFFSMDFVDGPNLAELTRGNPLPTRRAAACLKTVAGAVHFAHQRGILHRDLKPSNILMDPFDQPQITDFGLAKRFPAALGAPSGPASATAETAPALAEDELTLTGQVLGSPSYLPPEQAEGRAGVVSPASDVYGLGAVLYHLLTGRPPFQAGNVKDVLHQVSNADPVSPRVLNPSVPKDLETLCLKCLEKETSRRYPTAEALAEELDRFLRDEPILARPVSRMEKAWRWCRRRPVQAGLAAALIAVFALGLGGVLWQWRRAEQQVRIARHTTDFLTHMFESIDPEKAKLHEVKVREVLDEAGQGIATAFPNQPLTEMPIRLTLSTVYRKLGLADLALPHAEAALGLARAAHGRGNHLDELVALNQVVTCLSEQGRPTEALPQSEAALEVSRRLRKGDHPSVAESLNNLACCLDALGRQTEALPHYEAALAMRQRIRKGDHPDVAEGLSNLAFCLDGLGKSSEALANYEAALGMLQRVYPGDHPDVALALNNLGFFLHGQGRPAEGLAKFTAALEMRRRIYRGDHPCLAQSLNNVASCLDNLGRPAEALPQYEAALAMKQRIYPADNPDVALSLNNVAFCLYRLGRPAEALPKFAAALELRQRIYPGDHPEVAQSLNNLARSLETLERPAEALPKYEAALAMQRRLRQGDHTDAALALWNLASCLGALERPAEALPRHQEALAMFQRLLAAEPANHALRINVTQSHLAIGALLAETGDAAEAAGAFQQGLGSAETLLATEPVNVPAQQLRFRLRVKLGLEEAKVVVTRVPADSPADRLGLRKGDVLVRCAGERITSKEHFEKLIGGAKGAAIELEIQRDGQMLKFDVGEGRLGASLENARLSQE